MTTYTLTSGSTILRSDGANIPNDPANRDYAEYLEWVAAGNTPTPYVPPLPQPLTATPFQFRAGLTAAGLRAQVESAVSASGDQSLKDAYEYAAYFSEADPFITKMAASLNLSSDQVHAMFVSMQSLSA